VLAPEIQTKLVGSRNSNQTRILKTLTGLPYNDVTSRKLSWKTMFVRSIIEMLYMRCEMQTFLSLIFQYYSLKSNVQR